MSPANKKQKLSIINPLLNPKKNSVDPELIAVCKDLKLSPPAKEGVYRPLADIMLEIGKDGFVDNLGDSQQRAALIYLYGRSFLSGQFYETRRKAEVSMIFTSSEIMARLQTVLKDSTQADVAFVDQTIYGHWEMLVKVGWAMQDGDPYTVFDDKVKKMVLRRQLSQNCFMHAPCVLQGYLVQQGTGEFHGTIDLTKYARHYFCDKSFSQLVIHDNGGDSLNMLFNMVEESFWHDVVRANNKDFAAKLVARVKEYGPGLVRKFVVDESMADFKVPEGEHEYTNIPLFNDFCLDPAAAINYHAMVIVGYRGNDCGDGYNFLLQNWWPHMQFLEVTDKFLIASEAEVVFIQDKLLGFPTDYQINKFTMAEAHVPEGQDYGFPETEGI